MSLAVHDDPHWSKGTVIPLHGARRPARRQFVTPLPRQGASTQQTLDAALDLLAVAGEYIDAYARAHHTETTNSPAGRADTEKSVAWMRTSLHDITATLLGIATHPAE